MPMKDKEVQREYQRTWVAARRASYFDGKVCTRCGSVERLELDHIDPRTKITNRIWSWSAVRREAEIAKCQILCHSCHLVKTLECQDNPRGVQIGNAKLDEDSVRRIRTLFASGDTKKGLGRQFGVNDRTIRYLLDGTTWAHVM